MSQVRWRWRAKVAHFSESESEGYDSAIVRVNDPVALTECATRLKAWALLVSPFVDQFEQFRTVFLIIDSVLGLLGGISLW